MKFNIGDKVIIKSSYENSGKFFIGKAGTIVKRKFDWESELYFLISFDGYTPKIKWYENNLESFNYAEEILKNAEEMACKNKYDNYEKFLYIIGYLHCMLFSGMISKQQNEEKYNEYFEKYLS